MSQKTLARSIALMLVTLIGIGVFLLIALPRLNAPKPIQPMVELETEDTENLYAEFYVPEFELIDRNGDTITHEALDGQYTVVDFFFTSCPLWCPGMTQSMWQVQQATYGTDLRLMSISIDGEVDTPEAIDGYATRYRCDEDRWDYVTGDPEVVADLVKDGLKFDLGDPNETEDSGRLINHPTRLILLGPDRRVIGLYRYDDPDEVDELIADALKLMQ
ncbi:MAG: SCO family protein [Phycisphaerales bacterium]|nr:SCO family protein [Phycisphaerales bacterium]